MEIETMTPDFQTIRHEALAAGGIDLLSLRFRDASPLAAEQRDLLEAFVRQIALVLDRQRLRDAEQEAKLVSESERLSKTLLNSISHEIRTPIAAITSAASSLAEAREVAANQLQRTMVAEIQEAAFRGGTLQGAYFMLAARAVGLDCGPMSGFDNAGVDREFFAGTTMKSNFLCNLGYGDETALRPRAGRLEFDEACRIL